MGGSADVRKRSKRPFLTGNIVGWWEVAGACGKMIEGTWPDGLRPREIAQE